MSFKEWDFFMGFMENEASDLFVLQSDSFFINQFKKSHSLYMFLQCFQQRPFLKFSEKSSKFKFPTVTGT